MNQESQVSVHSETGPLKRVMLHKPGKEIDRLTIENMDELLFDDLLWLEQARKEHDKFADILRSEGAEVLYFNESLAKVLENPTAREELLKDVFKFENVDCCLSEKLLPPLMKWPALKLADHLIEGFTKAEIKKLCDTGASLVAAVENGSDFMIHPIPNLYFQRDPAMSVANGIILGQMTFPARRIEPLYWRYIIKNHPSFKDTPILYGENPDETWPHQIEGGDFLVLTDKALAIGISQRTAPATIEKIGFVLAKKTPIRRIFAFEIPKERYCMHLDTVFTMVDKDAFVIYPPILKTLKVWELNFGDDGKLLSIERLKDWEAAISKELGVPNIRLIKMEAATKEETAREQWHDGVNTFAVKPGVVVTYNRNVNATKKLEENGIRVIQLEGPELGRGRGGPRCMSMPLSRGPVKG